MDDFEFGLKERVMISVSHERGHVKGRAQYSSGMENHYEIHYKAADGRAVDGWFLESELAKDA